MKYSRIALVIGAVLALSAAGCQSSRFSSRDDVDTGPGPLSAAPSGQVAESQLPPPANSGADEQFPAAPGGAAGAGDAAALPPPPANNQVAEANAPDISQNSISGVWTATVSGQTCKIAMSQTKYGSSFRAAPLRCPAQLSNLKGWAIHGKQLVLLDDNGTQLASLYSSGDRRFDGQINGGTGITMALN